MAPTRHTRRNTSFIEGSVSSGGNQHTSPLWLLATAGVAGLFFFVFFVIQITGTEQAVYSFMQMTVTVTPQETAGQLLAMQSKNMDSSTLIADAIGWAVQLMLLIASFPSEHYIAWHIERARKYVMYILIGADWITDSLYVLRGHTVFDGFLHLAPGSLGVLVVAIIYPIAITAVTVFSGIEFAHRVDKLISCIRG